MSTWQQVFLVARRDFMQRARSRSFLATMAFIVALILIGGPFLSNASQADLSREVGLVGAVPDDTDLALESSGQAVDLEVTTTRYDTLDAAEAALSNGDVDALLVAGTADGAGKSASAPHHRLAGAARPSPAGSTAERGQRADAAGAGADPRSDP